MLCTVKPARHSGLKHTNEPSEASAPQVCTNCWYNLYGNKGAPACDSGKSQLCGPYDFSLYLLVMMAVGDNCAAGRGELKAIGCKQVNPHRQRQKRHQMTKNHWLQLARNNCNNQQRIDKTRNSTQPKTEQVFYQATARRRV